MPAAPGARPSRRRSRSELALLVLIAVAVIVLVRTFVLEAFFIPSGSMEATLRKPDRVLVNKLVYHTRSIRRGEIVVFAAPKSWRRPGERDFIKRVAGLPGDRVACCDAAGRVTVNGVALVEPYVDRGDRPSVSSFDVTIPRGRLFVLGDHRSLSSDSRRHLTDHQGTIPESSVIGRAFLVIWPVADWRTLPVPATFSTARPQRS